MPVSSLDDKKGEERCMGGGKVKGLLKGFMHRVKQNVQRKRVMTLQFPHLPPRGTASCLLYTSLCSLLKFGLISYIFAFCCPYNELSFWVRFLILL